MATKVAEVAALRRAFDVSLTTVEERWDETVPAETPPRQSLAERMAARRPTTPHEDPETVEAASEPLGLPDDAA